MILRTPGSQVGSPAAKIKEEGRMRGGGWREKGGAIEIHCGVDGVKASSR